MHHMSNCSIKEEKERSFSLSELVFISEAIADIGNQKVTWLVYDTAFPILLLLLRSPLAVLVLSNTLLQSVLQI